MPVIKGHLHIPNIKKAAIQPPVFERSTMDLPWISTGVDPAVYPRPKAILLSSDSMKYMASFFLRSEFPGVPCWEPSAGDLISELSITLNTQPLATGFPQSLSSVQINNSQNMERVMGPALH